MNDTFGFEYFAFYSNLDLTIEGLESGITGVVIDLEKEGKSNRQALYNTQVNEHHLSDIKKVRNATSSRIICRVNGGRFFNEQEILASIEAGADEILLPMVTSLSEIDFALKTIRDKAKLSLMIETNEAIRLAKQINEYPIHRVFVGLNDLSIARNQRNLFLPIVDGTVDNVRENISGRFGVAGLTHPGLGNPVACKKLINEMKRLKCTFGFLRRSYYADLVRYSQKEIIDALKQEFSSAAFDRSMSLELKNQLLESTDPLLVNVI